MIEEYLPIIRVIANINVAVCCGLVGYRYLRRSQTFVIIVLANALFSLGIHRGFVSILFLYTNSPNYDGLLFPYPPSLFYSLNDIVSAPFLIVATLAMFGILPLTKKQYPATNKSYSVRQINLPGRTNKMDLNKIYEPLAIFDKIDFGFTSREKKLMKDCLRYGHDNQGGLPGHNLILIIVKLIAALNIKDHQMSTSSSLLVDTQHHTRQIGEDE